MNTASVDAFIGLGSNLQDPSNQLRSALDELAALEATRVVAVSPFYASKPLGPADQPDYVNAVARLHTALPPEALLDALQAIENGHGRVRERHWGPRTLDLDILLYGDRRIATPRLVVPHPQMHLRAFVLVPLADIAPRLDIPGLGTLGGLLDGLDRSGIAPLPDRDA